MSLIIAMTVPITVLATNNVKAAGKEVASGDYTYQVETQAGKQYITLTDYKGKEEKITLPEEINGIEVTSVQNGFGKNSNLKSITFFKNMQKNLTALSDISTLEGVQASKDNTIYRTEDGVLYTKDKKELLVYPKSKKTETYIMPSEVEKIDDYNYVLTHLKYLKNLIFSKNLKEIFKWNNQRSEKRNSNDHSKTSHDRKDIQSECESKIENNKVEIHGRLGHSLKREDALYFFIASFPCYLQYQMVKLKT